MFTRVGRVLSELNMRTAAGFVLAILAFSGLFIWHLGSLTVGLSPSEAAARASSTDFHTILHSPINAPHRLLQSFAQSQGYHGATSMRLVSAFFALIFLICFYRLIKYWFGSFVGTLGTLMLAGTPLFIVLGRSATPNIMLLSPLLLGAALLHLLTIKRKTEAALIGLSVAAAFCLYSPGGIWFLLLIFGLCYKQLAGCIGQASNRAGAISAALMILMLAPLVWAAGRHWSVAQSLLLLPAHWHGFSDLGRAALWLAPSFIWHTRTGSEFVIGKVAILSASQIVLMIFGIYAMASQASREAVALIALAFVGLILASLNDSVSLLLIVLPVVSVFVAGGLRYLYVEWRTIFPKNPLPQGLATTLLVVLVGFQLVWGWHYALTAWPHTAATKSTYVIK